MNHNKGFTLIETMAVIAVLAILAAIAIPAYFSYVRNAKLATPIPMINQIQGRVADYRQMYSVFDGANNTMLNVNAFPGDGITDSVTVIDGKILVHLDDKYSDNTADLNPRWLFTPEVINNAVVWFCSSSIGVVCPDGYTASSQPVGYLEAPSAVPPNPLLPNTYIYTAGQNITNIPGNNQNGAIVYLSDFDDTVNISGADDVIYTGGGNDIINAGTHFDNIDAGSGDDVVNGGWGFDIIYSGEGSDKIDGGERSDNWKQTDTLVYVKPRAAYFISVSGDPANGGTIYVTDLDTGKTDEVKNIEQFKFGYNKPLNTFDLGAYEHKGVNGRNDMTKQDINTTGDFNQTFTIEYRDGQTQEGQKNQAQLDALLVN